MRLFCVIFAAGLVLVAGFCGAAFAQTNNTFTDALQNGLWNEDDNWFLEVKPTADHNAIIPNGLTCVIDYTQAVCSRFTIAANAVLQLDTLAVLTVDEMHGSSVASGCKLVLGRQAKLYLEGGGVITLDGTIEDVNDAGLPAHVFLTGDHTYVVRGAGAFVGNRDLEISTGGGDATLVLSAGAGIYGQVKVRPALINLGTVNPDNTFSQDAQVKDYLTLVCRPKIGTGTWRSDCTDCPPDSTDGNRLIFKTPILGTGNLEATRWGEIIVHALARVISLYGDFEMSGDGAKLEVPGGVVFDVDRYQTQNCP